MPGQARFLLINGSSEHFWHNVLEEALSPLGTLDVGTEANTITLLQEHTYDLIIIDATAVKDAPSLVVHIRSQQPSARIIVANTSPTWTWAREVFQAGATDYIKKSLDRGELLSSVEAALNKTLPPWR